MQDYTPWMAQRNFTGLASDSREVKPGYLFAALPGQRSRRRRFLADAVTRGAIAVLGVPKLAGAARALGVRFIADENPRLRLALLAAEFFGAQPETDRRDHRHQRQDFGRRFPAPDLDRTGQAAPPAWAPSVCRRRRAKSPLPHTTPDPIALHRLLAELKREGIEHLALEASSHGLDQFRLDGVRIAAAAFTNITRDHLDYHATFEAIWPPSCGLFRNWFAMAAWR